MTQAIEIIEIAGTLLLITALIGGVYSLLVLAYCKKYGFLALQFTSVIAIVGALLSMIAGIHTAAFRLIEGVLILVSILDYQVYQSKNDSIQRSQIRSTVYFIIASIAFTVYLNIFGPDQYTVSMIVFSAIIFVRVCLFALIFRDSVLGWILLSASLLYQGSVGLSTDQFVAVLLIIAASMAYPLIMLMKLKRDGIDLNKEPQNLTQ